MSLAWSAYRAVAPCLGALLPAARVFVSPQEREVWDERLGGTRLEGGADAWVHAASLGEATAVGPLVDVLAPLQPGARFLLTATTRGGRSRLAALGRPAAMAPLDAPQATARFFAGVHPRRLVLLETELWPHWLLRARALHVPVAVVSARLSERSLVRYRRFGSRFRALVAGLEAVLCQSEEDLGRWRALGVRAEVSSVTGNLKDDALPAPATSRTAARSDLGLDRERPLLVLGSVRPGEVLILARAWRRLPAGIREHWQVAVIPRHPRASAELRAEAQRAGVGVVVAAGQGGNARPRGAWLWDDRLGVLNGYYAAAEAAFVGGSLGPYGGHNPLEPAARGSALLMGPHHAAQRMAVQALVAAGALRVVATEVEAAGALEELLGNAEARGRAGEAALAVVAGRRGATRRTVARLVERGLWPTD
jgi:3-deoxy-D-manno-octulosonic-acid transferase